MGEQYKEICRACGKKRADQSNYGWGDASSDRSISIATKVYGKNTQYLTSVAFYPSFDVHHYWR